MISSRNSNRVVVGGLRRRRSSRVVADYVRSTSSRSRSAVPVANQTGRRQPSGLRLGAASDDKLNYFSDGGYGSLQPSSLGPPRKGAGLRLEADWDWATRGFRGWAIFQAAAAVELLFYHKVVNPTAMPVIVTAIACGVLRSASARDRLGGGTFRLLSLGLLFACSLLFLRAISSVGVLLAVASKGPVSLRVEALLLAQVPILFVSCFGCKAAYGTLAKEGLPKFKMALRAEKGRKWLLTLLAVGYFVTSLHQVLWGSASLFGGFPALGALRCFVVAACAHVCQTAAVAGPKRLSSETYRTLNLALLLDATARIAMLVAAANKPSALLASVLVFPAVDAFCAVGGRTEASFKFCNT
ncbi:CCD1 [Symbiodinium sp. CCMP2456]|nr:CCD1 [Symbiodinium sp. CCMP2456]